MTLPPEIVSLSRRAAQEKVRDLITENEKLKADLSRYQNAVDISAFLKQVIYIFQNAFIRFAPHTADLLFAILTIWLGHRAIDLLGKRRFFDWIPISYFFDAADIAVFLKFFAFVFKDFGQLLLKFFAFLIKYFAQRKSK
jgi:hypothetical protein